MKVAVLKEAGVEEALYAMSLSYYDGEIPVGEWWEGQREKAYRRSKRMCHQSGGHNDFLTLTAVWLEIEAPLFWWKQADRYQVGFRKMSCSTMHTLKKTGVKKEDFEIVPRFFDIEGFNSNIKEMSIEGIANELPDGYLQRRVVLTNYMTLRNIIWQRHKHKLPQWQTFCNAIYEGVKHPEFLPNLEG